jgi:hypothetical protein
MKILRLSEHNAELIINAVKMIGSFETEMIMDVIEESLNMNHIETIRKFLIWVNKNGKTFGRNIHDVYKEWMVVEFDNRNEQHKKNVIEMNYMREGIKKLKSEFSQKFGYSDDFVAQCNLRYIVFK